jgi:hypothetical protein
LSTIKRVYYAHPKNLYGTRFEKKTLKQIAYQFPKTKIENPNQAHHQLKYDARGMDYFFDDVLPKCDACCCQIYLDGKWGSGVAAEAIFFLKKKQPVYLIDPQTIMIRPLTETEKALLLKKDPFLVLTIEQTKLRIRKKKRGKFCGRIIPYKKAHLVKQK